MSLTARPNRLIALSNIRLPFSSMAGLGRPLLNLFMSHLSDDSPLLDVVVRALTLCVIRTSEALFTFIPVFDVLYRT